MCECCLDCYKFDICYDRCDLKCNLYSYSKDGNSK